MADTGHARGRGRGRGVLSRTASSALLLIGPTGAGKTPLGGRLEGRGLAGRRGLHFDFGAQLRAAAGSPEIVPGLSADELGTIRLSLETGALLEDRDFPIAVKILDAFETRMASAPGDILVLNGLPRHVGQAEMLEARIRVRAVAVLEASVETVLGRIRHDTGGDRRERADDRRESVELRFETYRERTLPLVGFYEARGASIIRVPVGVWTTAEEMREFLVGSKILEAAFGVDDPA